MASNPPGECCTKGFRHGATGSGAEPQPPEALTDPTIDCHKRKTLTIETEGEASGKTVDFGGIASYIVGDQSSKNVLLFLPDVFGHEFINSQLLADQYAEAGYLVVLPDIFKGDTILARQNGPAFDFAKDWLPHHTPEKTRPDIDTVYEEIVKKYAPTYITAVGYCFGAKYAIQLLGEKKVHAVAVFHPSFVTIDEIRAIKGPLFIAGAETDTIYTEELRKQTEATLKEIKATYFTTLASGVEHGFAVRGDITNPIVKFAKEKAFCDAVAWFKQSFPKN
ncbi:protein AIM2 [Sugiyamaella lignohabitans]|uniref:Protein AIM2 n=1 Tax=Sugiyamaella lignohabitans TaxID=796027 RepID=A0A161HJJ3_9ASCO|nr:protein AIM2 [Sugiyamaella lignohabitans]ANB12887.1 protein AIM2 [Sugiyamaella lignohabitans]